MRSAAQDSGGRTRTVSRWRLLPWAVVALWAAAMALAGPAAGRPGDVQVNRAVDYLPASADSTRVARIQDALPGGEATDLVLVYHRDSGLTASDRALADRQTAEVAAGHTLGAPPRAVPSKDGTTLMYPVSTTEPGQDDEARTALVDDVRETVRGGDGLSVPVGGPGALTVDAQKVYGSLGGPLLYTTVAILLILLYRSPLLWLVPLGVADALSMGVVHALNRAFDVTVTGQSSAVMTILVFGAGTDYALLLVSRYREELTRAERPHEAMAALRGCGPAVLAFSGTVAAGLPGLLAADLGSSRGMGPIAAVGVLCALLVMLTLLPAVLVLLGRRVFWPLVPVYGSGEKATVLAPARTAARPPASSPGCSAPHGPPPVRGPAPSACSPSANARSSPWSRAASTTPGSRRASASARSPPRPTSAGSWASCAPGTGPSW